MNGVRFQIISPFHPHGTGGGTCVLYVRLERGDQNFACAKRVKKTHTHTQAHTHVTDDIAEIVLFPAGYRHGLVRASLRPFPMQRVGVLPQPPRVHSVSRLPGGIASQNHRVACRGVDGPAGEQFARE
jgi:hypothetical protein